MTQIIGHQFASGTSSSRPDGDVAGGATGEAGGGAGRLRPDQSEIDPAVTPCGGPKDGGVESPLHSRPSFVFTLSPGESPAALQTGRATTRDGRSPLRPEAGAVPMPSADLVSIHISADAASLLALIAAERGESLGSAVARLVVAEIERKGGIARV